MTFVTGTGIRPPDSGQLTSGIELGFQTVEGRNGQCAVVDLNEAFGLKTAEVAGHKLAHRANLRCELGVVGRDGENDTVAVAPSFRFCHADQECDQPFAHSGEGKLFDNADEATEASADYAQDFKRDLGILKAERLKILAAEEQEYGVADGLRGGRIVSAVKNREFCDGIAGTVDGENLFAPSRRDFEYPYVARLDNVESSARGAFAEDGFARLKPPSYQTGDHKPKLVIRKVGEDSCLCEYGTRGGNILGHAPILPGKATRREE